MEVQSLPAYSVVVPAFRAGDGIIDLYNHLSGVFSKLEVRFEFIVVDDSGVALHSRALRELKNRNNNNVHGLILAKNSGQHLATFLGVKRASAPLIFTVDENDRPAAEQFRQLIIGLEQEKAELIYASYKDEKRSLIRKLGTNLINRSDEFPFGPIEAGSSFRLIRKELIDAISQPRGTFFYFDKLLRAITNRIAFLYMNRPQKFKNKASSSYGLMDLIRMFFQLIFNYTTMPLQAMFYVGTATAFFFFFWGGFRIVKKISVGAPLGYTSLIVVILFSTGLILMCLGVLGIYLRKIHEQLNTSGGYRIVEEI